MRELGTGRIPILSLIFGFLVSVSAYATPSTHIWAPSTDIQPYKKIHITADTYTPTISKATNADNYDQHNYVQQVYGLTFSLLSDSPEKNPLGKIMALPGGSQIMFQL